MPNIKVMDMTGNEVSNIELSDAIFGITPNVPAMHTMVVNYLANQRQGTQSTLTRTEVSGGGRKPWRQKGTGHARQGSTRAPQWTHGGIALGPKPRTYRFTVNKKLKRLAMKGQKALIVMPEVDSKVIKSASNIPGVKTALVNTINVYDILNYDKFVVVKDAVAKIEEVYA